MEARFEYWDAFKNLRSLVRRGSFVSRGKRRGEGEKKEKVIDGGSTKTTVDRFRGPGIVIEASIRLQFASKLRPFFFFTAGIFSRPIYPADLFADPSSDLGQPDTYWGGSKRVHGMDPTYVCTRCTPFPPEYRL